MARQTETGIGWCDETWSPIRGCSPVGPACDHCWAARMASRFSLGPDPLPGKLTALHDGLPEAAYTGFAYAGKWTGRVELLERELERPLHWRKPRRVAVGLMGDWMHEALDHDARDRILAVIAACQQHRFITLTKRWKRQTEYFTKPHYGLGGCALTSNIVCGWVFEKYGLLPSEQVRFPYPNLIVGVSAWDQASADEACRWLSQTPATCRLLCLEPLLGPVEVSHFLRGSKKEWDGAGDVFTIRYPSRLDSVIVGSETGPGARNCDWGWIRGVVCQCRAAGVAVFVKALLDRRGRKLPFEQWPEDLKMQEFSRLLDGREWNEMPMVGT